MAPNLKIKLFVEDTDTGQVTVLESSEVISVNLDQEVNDYTSDPFLPTSAKSMAFSPYSSNVYMVSFKLKPHGQIHITETSIKP